MTMNTHNINPLHLLSPQKYFKGDVNINTKFIEGFASRDIGMTMNIHIGIDSNGNWCLLSQADSNLIDNFQFWLGLQMDYELDVAEDQLEDKIDKEIDPMTATG